MKDLALVFGAGALLGLIIGIVIGYSLGQRRAAIEIDDILKPNGRKDRREQQMRANR